MKIMHFAIALSIMIVGSGHATVQTTAQTPENAHRFLMALAAEGRIQFEPAENYRKTRFYSSRGVNGKYSITSWDDSSSAGRNIIGFVQSAGCKTIIKPFNIVRKAYEREADWPGRNITVPGKETWHYYIPHLEHINANGIDWSRLGSVKAEGVQLTLKGTALSGGAIYFYFESPEMATRAAYAIEVIRQSCDPVADTGF